MANLIPFSVVASNPNYQKADLDTKREYFKAWYKENEKIIGDDDELRGHLLSAADQIRNRDKLGATAMETIGDIGIGVGTALGGSILGSFASPVAGTIAGGAAGGALGADIVQRRELDRGDKFDYSVSRTIAESALNAIPPAAVVGRGVMPVLRAAGKDALRLGAAGGAGSVAEQLEERGRVDPTKVAISAGANAIGAGVLRSGIEGMGRAYSRSARRKLTDAALSKEEEAIGESLKKAGVDDWQNRAQNEFTDEELDRIIAHRTKVATEAEAKAAKAQAEINAKARAADAEARAAEAEARDATARVDEEDFNTNNNQIDWAPRLTEEQALAGLNDAQSTDGAPLGPLEIAKLNAQKAKPLTEEQALAGLNEVVEPSPLGPIDILRLNNEAQRQAEGLPPIGSGRPKAEIEAENAQNFNKRVLAELDRFKSKGIPYNRQTVQAARAIARAATPEERGLLRQGVMDAFKPIGPKPLPAKRKPLKGLGELEPQAFPAKPTSPSIVSQADNAMNSGSLDAANAQANDIAKAPVAVAPEPVVEPQDFGPSVVSRDGVFAVEDGQGNQFGKFASKEEADSFIESIALGDVPPVGDEASALGKPVISGTDEVMPDPIELPPMRYTRDEDGNIIKAAEIGAAGSVALKKIQSLSAQVKEGEKKVSELINSPIPSRLNKAQAAELGAKRSQAAQQIELDILQKRAEMGDDSADRALSKYLNELQKYEDGEKPNQVIINWFNSLKWDGPMPTEILDATGPLGEEVNNRIMTAGRLALKQAKGQKLTPNETLLLNSTLTGNGKAVMIGYLASKREARLAGIRNLDGKVVFGEGRARPKMADEILEDFHLMLQDNGITSGRVMEVVNGEGTPSFSPTDDAIGLLRKAAYEGPEQPPKLNYPPFNRKALEQKLGAGKRSSGRVKESGPVEANAKDLSLESATPDQLADEAAAVKKLEALNAQREAIAEKAEAPLVGNSENVGQGVILKEDTDLFSGKSAEELADNAPGELANSAINSDHEKIQKYLDEIGVKYDISASGKSGSLYVTAYPKIKGEVTSVKFRVSDHEIPSYYAKADIDVSPMALDGPEQAIEIFSKKTGIALPESVKSDVDAWRSIKEKKLKKLESDMASGREAFAKKKSVSEGAWAQMTDSEKSTWRDLVVNGSRDSRKSFRRDLEKRLGMDSGSLEDTDFGVTKTSLAMEQRTENALPELAKPTGAAQARAERQAKALLTPEQKAAKEIQKAIDDFSEAYYQPDLTKAQAKSWAKKLEAMGVISKRDLDEALMVASDRDMSAEDVIDAFRRSVEEYPNKIKSAQPAKSQPMGFVGVNMPSAGEPVLGAIAGFASTTQREGESDEDFSKRRLQNVLIGMGVASLGSAAIRRLASKMGYEQAGLQLEKLGAAARATSEKAAPKTRAQLMEELARLNKVVEAQTAGTRLEGMGGPSVAAVVAGPSKGFDPAVEAVKIDKANDAARKGTEKNVREKMLDFTRYFERKLVTANEAVYRMAEWAEKSSGMKLRASEDPRIITATRGMNNQTQATAFIKQSGLADFFIEKLPAAAKAAGMSQESFVSQLDKYLISKHALTRYALGATEEQVGGGFTREVATNFVASLEKTMEAHAKVIRDAYKQLLEKSVEDNLISRELADWLKKTYPDYVPFGRIFDSDEIAAGLTSAIRNGKATASINNQTVVQKFIGSERGIESPMEELFNRIYSTYQQGGVNATAESWMNLGSSKWLGDSTGIKLLYKVGEDGNPLRAKGIFEKIDDNAFRMLNSEGKAVVDEAGKPVIVDRSFVTKTDEGNWVGTGDVITDKEAIARAKHTISRLYQGERLVAEVPRDFEEAAKGLNVPAMGLFAKIFNLPVRVGRAGFTSLNPTFALRQIPRDLQQIIANTDGFSGIPKLIKGYGTGIKDAFASRIPEYAKATGQNVDSEIVKRWEQYGGKFNFTDQFRSSDESRKTVSRLMGNISIGERPMAALRRVEDTISAFEDMGRIAVFKSEIDRLAEPLIAKGVIKRSKVGVLEGDQKILDDIFYKAAHESQERSANYLNRGEWGRALNGVFLYLNAGIQGTRANVAAFKRSPTTYALKAMIGGGAALATATAYNLSDPDRAKAYMDLTEDERSRNLILMHPMGLKDDDGNYIAIKIPLPTGLSGMAQTPRRIVEDMYGFSMQEGKPEMFEAAAKDMFGFFTPIEPDSNKLLSFITPQAVRPILEASDSVNRNFFSGQMVVPRYLQKLPPADQFKPSTSLVAREIGAALNISPIKLEYLTKNYTGTLGSTAIWAADQAISKATGKESPARSIAQDMVNAFSTARGGEQLNRFYSEFEQSSKIYEGIKAAFARGDVERGNELIDENRDELIKYNTLKSYNQKMTKMYSDIRKLEAMLIERPDLKEAVQQGRAYISELATQGVASIKGIGE